MKTVRDVMTSSVIRVSPSNKIKTAVILMKGHNIGGLPVMDADRVLGVLDYQDILGKDNDIPVQSVMDKEFVAIPVDMPVTDAADLMAKINADRLFVMDGGVLAGVVTRGDLLPELGRSLDPITGLPRADAMRDWGIEALKSGREVTVIFIDLDNFGHFNKMYGHIIGDRVLQHVAKVLENSVDPNREMLCRYAGDEFVIVTTRNADEAQEFADALGVAMEATPNDELPEPVTGSIGVRGGKRTKEREETHYNATLDNLINLASKSCTVAKENRLAAASLNGAAPMVELTPEVQEQSAEDTVFETLVEEALEALLDKPAEGPAPGTAPSRRLAPVELAPREHKRLKIQSLNFSWDDSSRGTAEVELVNGEHSVRQSCSGYALGNNALRLVADATAQAVCEFLPTPGYGVVADHVHLIHSGPGEDIIVATVLLITPQAQIRLAGSAIVRQDVYRSVSAAFMSAINRQISAFL